MRILVVTYSSNLNGGANRSLLMVLEYLCKTYNHDVLVVVPSKGELCNALDNIGVNWIEHRYHAIAMVNTLSIKNIGRCFKHLINSKRNENEAKKQYNSLKKHNFEIVYINNNGATYGANLAKLLDIPYVWHFRGEIYTKNRYLKNIAELIKDSDKLIAISEDMKKLYKQNNILSCKEIEVIHNGISLNDELPADQNRYNGFHIIQCGRISEEKGQFEAVKAIAKLSTKYTDIILHIVGKATGIDAKDYERRIKKYIDEKQLQNHVVFEGYINDVNKFRRDMNCELVCSLREPFGRVTVEGMRMGLIVIGSNTGGTVEIIQNGVTGLLYEQGDFLDLANKIEQVYSDSEFAMRIATKGREYSMNHFLPEENVEKINNLLIESANK